MKNIIGVFFGAFVGFISFTGISLLFKKFNWFDFGNRSLENITIEAVIITIFTSFFIYIYNKRRLRKK
jgi:hypothetical protein